MDFGAVIQGTASGIGHLANTAAQANMDLGTKLVLDDGRIFRYTENGATAQVVGALIEGKPHVSGDVDLAIDATVAAGAESVTITTTQTTAADYYADGWMIVSKAADALALGQVTRVESHLVFANSAGHVITLSEDAPIIVATAAADEVSFSPNIWSENVIAATTLAGMLIGVCSSARTADYFGWTQRGGVAAISSATSTVIGNHLECTTAAAGRAGVPAAGGVLPTIGIVMTIASAADECDTCFMTLDQ